MNELNELFFIKHAQGSSKGSGRLCRKPQELYELIGPLVRTLVREYDQQITERHSLDRAERGPGEASELLPS